MAPHPPAQEPAPLALEALPVPAAALDFAGRFVRVNEAFSQLLGYKDHELDGQNARDVIHPDDTEAFDSQLQTLRTGVVAKACAEHRYLTPSGRAFWAKTHVGLQNDTLGQPIGLLAIAYDISDKSRGQEALERDLRRLEVAIGAYSDLLFELDGTGHILEYRSAGLDDLYIPPTQFLGRTVPEVLPPEAADRIMEAIEEAIATGRSRGHLYPLAVEGTPRWFEVSVGALTPAATEASEARLIALVRDVTPRVQAEERLREADRRKTEFLAMLSHELRNPLAAIHSSLTVLERVPPGSDRAGRALAVIGRQSAHLTRLVDDLLDLTRVARGTVTISKELVELGGIVRRATEDEQAACAANGVRLRLDVEPSALWCVGDAVRLAQVVSNLLSNACKFTHEGGHVDVSLTREASTGVLRVRDDGVGIAPDMLSRVFDTFVQADTSLARRRGGLGLGLALVRTLVELHDGTVEVYSAGRGQGTEFTVRLPLSAAPEAVALRQTPPKPSHRRVILIEDNPDAAESLHALLELHGHDVSVSHSGHEGIAVARDFHPDVIICDVGLPDLDGYEVARVVRADESLRDVFLIALTGYALYDDIQRAYAAGFDRHLAKPPSEELLEQAVSESPRHPRS